MKILGIDYGRSKIGIAIGETETKSAEPLEVIKLSNCELQIKEIIGRENIKMIVLGLPGEKMDKEIKKFGEELKKETGLPVEYFDETLSTQDAQRILINNDRKRKTRKEREDAVAAAIMLEYWLETL